MTQPNFRLLVENIFVTHADVLDIVMWHEKNGLNFVVFKGLTHFSPMFPVDFPWKHEKTLTLFYSSMMRFSDVFKGYKKRSSHQRCSMKKVVIKNFAKFTGKHLFQGLIFNKVAGLRSATLLKKRLWHRCFPVNYEKFLRTPPDDCFIKRELWHEMS